MKIASFSFYTYQIPYELEQIRSGLVVHLSAENGKIGWGEIAPLPNWSKETLSEAIVELKNIEKKCLKIEWTAGNISEKLGELSLHPSIHFGLESALFFIFNPIPPCRIPAAALLKGTLKQILEQASLRYSEGYSTAKLKVSNLSFEEAENAILNLKERFRLRIDVNRAWKAKDSIAFFSKFPINTFDYIEEPFFDLKYLNDFSHPIAIDESYPSYLSIKELEQISNLKALIYKPTIQGGLSVIRPLLKWCQKRTISLILSSSFESDLGLYQIATLAARLSLSSLPLGIGTYFHMKEQLMEHPLNFFGPYVNIGENMAPKKTLLKLLE